MKTTTKKISDTSFEVKVTLEPADLAEARKKALPRLAREVNVEGFRKGKVPVEVAEKFIPENDLNRETADIAVRTTVPQAFSNNKQTLLAIPSVEITKYVPGETLEYTAKAEVLPEIKLADWKNLGVKKKVVKVEKKDIDQILENLSNSFAEKKVVKRAAKNSDEVIIDFVGKKDGKAFEGGSAKDYHLMLGSGNFIPGFEEGILGHSSGDKFDLNLTFPKEYHVSDLAGAEAVFEVLVKQVNEVTSAKIDDDLAKKCGPFKNLGELKADIEKNLAAQMNYTAENQFKDDLVNALAKKSKVSAPEILVNDQLRLIRSDTENNARSAGLPFSEYLTANQTSEEDWEKDAKKAAEERVKASLALQVLAREEDITVEDADVSAKLAELKDVYKKSPEALENLKKPEVRNEIKNRMILEKTIDLLVKENSKSESK